MPDREKVISGLEHCGFTEKRGCNGCPYEDECINFGNDAGHGSICTDALALLRGQDKTANSPPFQRHDCGALIVYRGRDVCPNCGRAVKWNA